MTKVATPSTSSPKFAMQLRSASPSPSAEALRKLIKKNNIVGMLLLTLTLLVAVAQIGLTLYGDYYLIDAVLNSKEEGKLGAWAKYNRITQVIMAWTALHALIVQPNEVLNQLTNMALDSSVQATLTRAGYVVVLVVSITAFGLLSPAMFGDWEHVFSSTERSFIALGLGAHAILSLLIGLAGLLGIASFVTLTAMEIKRA